MAKSNPKKNQRIFTIAFFIGLFVFSFWPNSLEKEFFLLSEDTNLIIHTKSKQTFYTHTQPLSFHPSFWNPAAEWIWEQEIGATKKSADFFLTRISENFAFGEFNDTRIAFFRDQLSDTEITAILKQPVSLETDFWVFEKTLYPEFLPLPKQAIIFITNRAPSEKLQKFCAEKNVPLLSTKAIDEFLIRQKEDELSITVND